MTDAKTETEPLDPAIVALVKALARDLAREEGGLIEEGKSYPVWAPESAFGAAASLMQALKDEEGPS